MFISNPWNVTQAKCLSIHFQCAGNDRTRVGKKRKKISHFSFHDISSWDPLIYSSVDHTILNTDQDYTRTFGYSFQGILVDIWPWYNDQIVIYACLFNTCFRQNEAYHSRPYYINYFRLMSGLISTCFQYPCGPIHRKNHDQKSLYKHLQKWLLYAFIDKFPWI